MLMIIVSIANTNTSQKFLKFTGTDKHLIMLVKTAKAMKILKMMKMKAALQVSICRGHRLFQV